MATKTVEIEGIGPVALTKRKGARSIRLSIGHAGQVRVSLPYWAPYSAAVSFVRSKQDWVLQQLPQKQTIAQGHPVGKAHHIHFEAGQGKTVTTRLSGNQVRIMLPPGTRWDSIDAQDAVQAAAIRALKKEARQLLPFRLKTLAQQHDYTYNSIAIKRLSGRWGSCSEHQDIILNCYLMQLPWSLIDYVIMHELAHTRVMAHGPAFWQEMAAHVPDLQQLRKQIKLRKPVL